jgi:hypothetical protein
MITAETRGTRLAVAPAVPTVWESQAVCGGRCQQWV